MMTILVASFSQGAEAWLRLCVTTEGIRVFFFGESFSLVDQYASADPSLSVMLLAVAPTAPLQSWELHVKGL